MKIKDALVIASGECGNTEYPPGSNDVKYNTWYYGQEVRGDQYPWCCVFIQWVFRNTGILKRTASCTTLYNFMKEKGRTSNEPHVGDLVFFNFDKNPSAGVYKHIGIVTEVLSPTKIKCIEGNTSFEGKEGSQSNGGCVALRNRSGKCIRGYATPEYTDSNMNPNKTKRPTLKLGSKGSDVLYLHEKLKQLKYGVEGDLYNENTKNCVMHFQKINNLTVDGICGSETWGKIDE